MLFQVILLYIPGDYVIEICLTNLKWSPSRDDYHKGKPQTIFSYYYTKIELKFEKNNNIDYGLL